MGETAIEWTRYTFNPWWGCAKLANHRGCKNCYAAAEDRRWHLGLHWGAKAPRRMSSDRAWQDVLRWDRKAREAERVDTVFCGSMMDVFEPPHGLVTAQGGTLGYTTETVRRRLWGLIENTPNLIWLLLTKRPQCAGRYLPAAWKEAGTGGKAPGNVWVGYSASDQGTLEMGIDHLLRLRADFGVRLFLSLEPLVNGIDLSGRLQSCADCGYAVLADGLRCAQCALDPAPGPGRPGASPIEWVIVGGESGAKSAVDRCYVGQVRDLIGQCGDRGVACFVKQLGRRPFMADVELRLANVKGGDMGEWPGDLRVREYPDFESTTETQRTLRTA